MSSRWELDDGIKLIKSAWQHEHTARTNLEKMLENAEAENAKLRELFTCHVDETETYECVRDDMGGYGKRLTVHVMECGKCGHTYEHVNGSYEYCPRCGRKVVG